MAYKDDEEKQILNIPGASRVAQKQQASRLVQQQPVIDVPAMDRPARFTDPAAGNVADEREFRGDPNIIRAAQRGETLQTPNEFLSAFRSDGPTNYLLGERSGGQLVTGEQNGGGVIPDSNKAGGQSGEEADNQAGNGDVIPQQRYTEMEDPRINKLGFRRMDDTWDTRPGHLGIYTNLNDGAFNAEMDSINNTESGGSFSVAPAEQMKSQVFSRRIAGRLPSGASYEYFLKPGEMTGYQEEAVRQNQQNAMPQFNGSVHSAQAMQHYEEARKQNILNGLADHFKDSDPELAAQMLGISRSGKGVIDMPEYGVTSQKTFDDMGNVATETPVFYSKNGPNGPVAYNMNDVIQRPQQSQPVDRQTMYQQFVQKAKAGVGNDQSKLPDVLAMAKDKYPEFYNESDFQL
jgi:hypothetical protein